MTDLGRLRTLAPHPLWANRGHTAAEGNEARETDLGWNFLFAALSIRAQPTPDDRHVEVRSVHQSGVVEIIGGIVQR